ncbi:zinc metalloproteinase-disintegrin-like 4a [Hyperolius riggenbachi]|uniref:zinc metalloproteinase-disintegrin-like 4a n=1 Tax=Hyperolius riggenbachi TaxID=752182 RepID=UPI0035A29A36
MAKRQTAWLKTARVVQPPPARTGHYSNKMTLLGPVLFLLFLHSQILALSLTPEQKYQVVYPQKLHSRQKRNTQSKYPDEVHYGLALDGKPIEIQLEKTENLLANHYTETLYRDDDTPVTTSPARQDHCYYQGRVKNDSSSQVSLSLCEGLSGLIMTQKQKLLIEPLKKAEDGAHALFTSQDHGAPKACGLDHTKCDDPVMPKPSFSMNNAEMKEFLQARKYIQLYLVVDHSVFIKYNRDENTIRTRIFQIMNYVNMVYKHLNIFVALTGIEIWTTRSQIEVVSEIGTTLDRFSTWRTESLLPRKRNDNAQLLTNVDFNGAEVGYAYVEGMCSDIYSAGVIQDHSPEYIKVAATIAHEMGHNIGMEHDKGTCNCSPKPCVMVDKIGGDIPEVFSACSLQKYQKFLVERLPLCMKDMPDKSEVQSSPVCGNKFTEIGEECDCGSEAECTDKCCDATTCKLKEGAQCTEGGCCSSCQLQPAGSVCRPAKDECDLSDMCDGKSPVCSDRFRANGSPCKNGDGYCFNGKCPTHQDQCEKHWGPASVVGDKSCCDIMKSDKFCQISGAISDCTSRDLKCGVLFCSEGNTNPLTKGGFCAMANCKTFVPVKLVEDGSKCKNGSVCLKGKCVPVTTFTCSVNCPGHAVCDHEQKCHCEEGWAPPNCDTRTLKQFQSGYIALSVILLLILVAAVLFILYKRSQRRNIRSCERTSGLFNSIFYFRHKAKEPQYHYSSTPQAPLVTPAHPPQPPTQSQKPPVQPLYTPQPPAQSQKPPVQPLNAPQPPTQSQKRPVQPLYTPQPPAQSQKPPVQPLNAPQPPAQSQKPPVQPLNAPQPPAQSQKPLVHHLNPPLPPVQSQKPLIHPMRNFLQPPAQSQKPQVSQYSNNAIDGQVTKSSESTLLDILSLTWLK